MLYTTINRASGLMCGIAGSIWWQKEPRLERLSAALSRMRHRGPNDHGMETHSGPGYHLALGQTRLSVIDLSEGGHQPMVSQDKQVVLVFNGEIYNYRELRSELQSQGHIFSTQSDTEVLLAAWRQWGAACLKRLDGMFAFAIHDRVSGQLHCARDAFGIKPFFYRRDGDALVFASELSALLELSDKRPSADLSTGYRYLIHGQYDVGDRTFYEGIRHLRPGHLLTVELASGQSTLDQWWRPDIRQTSTLSFGDAAEAVRETFLTSIRRQLRSDVPLGAALSGGVDSSAVVCAIRHVEPDMPIHAFSYIAAGSDVSEEAWAEIVVKRTGASWYKTEATAQDLARDIDTLVSVQGEPFGSTSIYAQYRVYQLAKHHGMTVTLDGQGADELLAGYQGYPGSRMASLLESGQIGQLASFVREWSKWPGRNGARGLASMLSRRLPDSLHRLALSGVRRQRPDWIVSDSDIEGFAVRAPRMAEGNRRRVMEELAFQLQHAGLPQLLRHGDRNSMRFSIESRVPFLSLPLAELLLSLPEQYLISSTGETKSVFRAAMRGIVPDEILDRRDKVGFATPERDWILALAPTLRVWLQDADQVPLLRREPLLAAFDEIISGKRPFSWQVWRWVNYVRWYAQNF